MTSRRRLGVLACLLAAVMACLAPAASAVTGRDDPTPDPVRPFGGAQVRDPQQAQMRALTSGTGRPTYGTTDQRRTCDEDLCVHYVTTGSDAAKARWATKTLKTLEHVYSVYDAAGYKMPEADASDGDDSNPDGRIDIYLADIGPTYYGYCSRAAAADPEGKKDKSAFCVLDNDYSKSQYPARASGGAQTPLENLEVTAAHEFFHAVQFAYDASEDPWFAEATATWAEDEVYSGINDNRQYLPYGPLGKPRQAMDLGAYYDNLGVYGDWLFFRYLSERFPAKTGALPTIVRQMWEAADSTGKFGKDRYSIQAVAAVLKQHGTTLQQQWGRFTDANRHPAKSYSEGAAYHVAAPAGVVRLGGTKRQASGHYSVDHLASATERFVPRKVRRGARLRVTVKTARPTISAATVSVWLKGGRLHTKVVDLKGGHGQVTVPFANTGVAKVEVTLANAAALYRCHRGGNYSCAGTPLRDNLKLSWAAKLLR